MIRKSVLIVLIIMSVVMSASWIETWYWRYWNFEPVVIYPLTKNGAIRILNPDKKVFPGNTLAYEIEFDKKTNDIPTINRSLRNSYIYNLAPSVAATKPLGRQIVWTAIKIPRMAEYGIYRLTWTAVYEIGPEKREISVTVFSEPFEVVKEKR